MCVSWQVISVVVIFMVFCGDGNPKNMLLVTAKPMKTARIIEYLNDAPTGDGSYSYKYSTSNDISQQQTGIASPLDGVLRVSGSYAFRTPDGKRHLVVYTADELGYRARIIANHDEEVPPFGVTQEPQEPDDHKEEEMPGFIPVVPIIGSAVLGSLAGK